MKQYTITEVTDWEEDWSLIEGDSDHEGKRAINKLVEKERAEKIDNGKQNGLPFTCEAESEDDAIEQYNETVCEEDYFKATACEFAE